MVLKVIYFQFAAFVFTAHVGIAGEIQVPGALEKISLRWQSPTQILSGEMDDIAADLATDSTGIVYVVGVTRGAFPGFSNSGGLDCFLRKVSSAGKLLWVKQFGTSENDICTGVSVDSTGSPTLIGYTWGTLFNERPIGDADAFAVRFGSDGSFQWISMFGTSGRDIPLGITRDSSNVNFIVGSTTGKFAGESHAGGRDAFIARIRPNGNWQWVEQFGTAADEEATSIDRDTSNRIYVGGYTYGRFSGQVHAGAADAFVARYRTSGNQQWLRQFGTSQDDVILGVGSLTSSGNFYASGYSAGNFPSQVNQGGDDALLVRYEDDGSQNWLKLLGSSADDYLLDIGMDGSENAYACGTSSGNWGSIPSQGDFDILLLKVNPSGTRLWEKLFGSTGFDSCEAIYVDMPGRNSLAGYTSGTIPGFASPLGLDAFLFRHDANGSLQWNEGFGSQ